MERQETIETTTLSTRVTPELSELVKAAAVPLGFRNTSSLIEQAIRYYLTSHGYAIRFNSEKPKNKIGIK